MYQRGVLVPETGIFTIELVAEKLCNKVAIIKQGKIVANGKMSEIKKDKALEDVFMELEKVDE